MDSRIIRPKTKNFLEENMGSKPYGISLRKYFGYVSLDAAKAKMNKWDHIKLKSFCTVKETTNKMKR